MATASGLRGILQRHLANAITTPSTVRHAAADVGGGSISSALDSQHAIGLAIVACYFLVIIIIIIIIIKQYRQRLYCFYANVCLDWLE